MSAAGRLSSLAWLGWRFAVVQPVRRALRRRPAQERFADAYFGEGLLPIRGEDREIALAAAACTGCGLCEPRCALAGGAPAASALGLQAIFRLHAKHPGEVRHASALVERCAACTGCDDACPSGVPIARIVRHLRGLAAR